MPSAVRKSAARSSPEHVSFPSPRPVHSKGLLVPLFHDTTAFGPVMRRVVAGMGASGGSGLGEGGGKGGAGPDGGNGGAGGGPGGGDAAHHS